MATKMNLKAPTQFDPDTDRYIQFKRDLEIWDCLTDLPATKKGPAIYLSLSKKAQGAVIEVRVADIKKEDGMETIVKKLDEIYLIKTG